MELARNNRWLFFPVLVFLGAWLGAGWGAPSGKIFRCAEGDGWEFQQTPCAPGAGAEFALSPENRVGSPLRPSERRYVEERAKASGHRRSNIRAIGGDSRSSQASSAKTCLRKSQTLERVRRTLRHGYRPAAGERLRRRRDDLDEYLRRFCE